MRCRRHHVAIGIWAFGLLFGTAALAHRPPSLPESRELWRDRAVALAKAGSPSSYYFKSEGGQSAPAAEALSAKVWLGRHAEFEEYLRTANVDKTEELSIGVTRPRRVFFPPGGLAESAAWKAIRPGHYKGYWESYQSEVAAYELDKLLDLQMIPPVVERRVAGNVGAAVLWVKPVKMYKEVTPADIRDPGRWAVQLDKMRLFDQLIGNSDRNAGNFLLDPGGNLILIDHSRAFPTNERLTMDKVPRIDTALWARIETFSDEALTKALEPWLMGGQVKSLVKRRALLRKEIEKRKAAYGKTKTSH